MAMAMGAGCGCGVVAQQPLVGLHQHHPSRLAFDDEQQQQRQQQPRDLPHHGGNHNQDPNSQYHQPQSTRILHNILSMKIQRHELVADSPPGHGYVHVPEDTYYSTTAQARFPTPPSSLPSTPEPQQQNCLADFTGYGSSGGCSTNSPTTASSSSRASPSSTYSMDSAPESPRTSSPGTFSCSPGISRVYRYRRSQSSTGKVDSQSPPVYNTNSTSGCNSQSSSACIIQPEEDEPVNLRKHQYSPSRTEYNEQHYQKGQTLEEVEENEENIPMDLSVPSKKQRIEENSEENLALSFSICHRHTPSPLPTSSTPSRSLSSSLEKNSSYHCDQQYHPYRRLHRRRTVNPHLVYHPEDSSSSSGLSSASILKSILCGQLSSKRLLPAADEVIDELRTGSPFMYTLSSCQGLTRSPAQRVSELIRRAKIQQQSLKTRPAVLMAESAERHVQSTRPDHEVSPLLLSHPMAMSAPSAAVGAAPPSPSLEQPRNTVVSLAKKNLLPVTARISDWLVKVVQYIKSLPEFSSLALNDKVTLIQSSWSRLLLLKMAECNFQFAVNPCPKAVPAPSAVGLSDDARPVSMPFDASSSLMQPTLEAVEGIVGFVRKCQALAITPDEMSFLRLLTLFNPSHIAVESSTYIEKINTYVRKCLHESCLESDRGSGNRRYCQLLLVLPPLFGVRPGVMESLFCKHITVNTDMDLLLKEMLHKL